ncbi:MAG TPA: hypothetical protein VJ841_02875 [Candidatus Saccharimonadales bacterium]|nr:hypothetical protein [Candidatus Saccharimonadales bacterium]
MNKKIISFSAVVFGMLGGYLPSLFGDTELFDGWTILGGLVGGIIGVWIGVYVAKRWGE